jgi:hypothetical protein
MAATQRSDAGVSRVHIRLRQRKQIKTAVSNSEDAAARGAAFACAADGGHKGAKMRGRGHSTL